MRIPSHETYEIVASKSFFTLRAFPKPSPSQPELAEELIPLRIVRVVLLIKDSLSCSTSMPDDGFTVDQLRIDLSRGCQVQVLNRRFYRRYKIRAIESM